MQTITSIISWLINLMPVGLGVRIAICALKMINNEDRADFYKARLKNAIIWCIIAGCVWGFKELIFGYLSNRGASATW